MLKTMDWQQGAALLIVAVTAGVFAWMRLRPRRFEFKRDTACGCGGSVPGPKTSITFKARKGQRPQVFVKME